MLGQELGREKEDLKTKNKATPTQGAVMGWY